MAYTLEQLQKMGAKPVAPNPAPAKAPAGGYTLDQLTKMGAKPVESAPPEESRGVLGTIADTASDIFKSVTKPAVTLGVRPYQLAKAVGGAEGKDLDVNLPYYGKIEAPKTAGDVVKDVGRAVQTVALGTPISKVEGVATAGAKALGFTRAATNIGKVAGGAATGYGLDVGTKLEAGKGAESFVPGAGTAFGAIIPAAGIAMDAVSKSVQSGAPRVVNSLIKPLKKDLSYGKNPGRAVAEEGIVANNMDDLLDQITKRREVVGEKIGEKLSASSKRIDISALTKPIDEAIKSAKGAPRTNAGLLTRLEALKSDILGEVTDAEGVVSFTRKLSNMTPKQAMKVKALVGDLTKFTGNHSDDAIANKAMKRVYGVIKEKINRAVPGVASLNERYADLLSAQVATKYRNEILERSNMIGLGAIEEGIGAALLTSFATGGAAIPSILMGVTASGMNKALSSTAFKTRLAAMLARQTPAERAGLFKALEKASPAIKEALQKLVVQQTAKSTLGNPR